jgi:alpha-tubulin suppressor-like RCC1 family protein
LIGTDNKVYVWGANTNGEMGTGDTHPRIQPTLIESIQDKDVFQVSVGSAYAFALGYNMKQQYQSYLTTENIP